MDSNHLNVTRGLVRAILDLTVEQRRSTQLQSYCQTIYCLFTPEDPEDHNGTCHVVSRKLTDDPVERSTFFISAQKIFLYLYSIFIFFGIIGNSCSCLIMFLNVRRNGYPANFYLTLLAFIDCLFLLGSAIPDLFSRFHGQWNIRFISDLSCRFVYWFGNFTTHLSAGLVVSVTVERFLAIQYPLLAHRTNSVAKTHGVLLMLVIFFFVLDSRVFFLVQHIKENIHIVQTCSNRTDFVYSRQDTFRCDIPRLHWRNAWVWIDFAVYTLIPFLIIVTFNSLIIRRLILAQRSRQKMGQFKRQHPMTEYLSVNRTSDYERRRTRSVPPTPRQLTPSIPRPRSLRQCSSTSPSHRSTYSSSSIRSNSNQHNIRLTVLLLLISCSFLLLTLPAVVINLIMVLKWKSSSIPFLHQITHSNENNTDEDDDEFYYSIARLLMVINHSTNFVLYLLVGKRFRRDLKRLCLHCFQRTL